MSLMSIEPSDTEFKGPVWIECPGSSCYGTLANDLTRLPFNFPDMNDK